MTSSAHDVVVIGGGVTGAGVARDLARRGASVLLLEKGDYGGGTSGASSWMIHGGPRYLEFDWRTTRLSAEDAGKIVTIARHMVHRVVFLIPVMPGDKHNIERLETAMEVYDRFQPLKRSNRHLRLTAAEARQMEPGLTDRLVGAMTMEEWGVDPHRLTFANVQDAIENGARAMNHSRVIGLIRDGDTVLGVRYRGADGGVNEARAKVTVNATGPWSQAFGRMAGVPIDLRPAKGIHIVYDRRVSNFAISCDAVDGRGLLLVPHGNFTLVGTTDDDFYGDPDDIEVTPDEVDYILQAFDRVMPGLRRHRAIRATAGVRPTIFRWRSYEDNLSRRYEIVDHGGADKAPGLVSVIGGKLSMYRLMAEEASDLVCRKLGIDAPVQPALRHCRGTRSRRSRPRTSPAATASLPSRLPVSRPARAVAPRASSTAARSADWSAAASRSRSRSWPTPRGTSRCGPSPTPSDGLASRPVPARARSASSGRPRSSAASSAGAPASGVRRPPSSAPSSGSEPRRSSTAGAGPSRS